MNTEVFSSRIAVGKLPLNDEHLFWMKQELLELNLKRNPRGRPWTRETTEPIGTDLASLRLVDTALFAFIEGAFGVKPKYRSSREVVVTKGNFLPPHIEPRPLIAVVWADTSPTYDHAKQDFAGCFTITSPNGVLGAREIPWAMNPNWIYKPEPGSMVVFPGYLMHWMFPYASERPSVAVHYELDLDGAL